MDFSGMIKTWINVLTRPGEEVFEEERQSENATFQTTAIWIIIAAVIAAIFGAIGAAIRLAFQFGSGFDQFLDQMDPAMAEQLGPLLGSGTGFGAGAIAFTFCLTLIIAPIAFFIGSGIYLLVAKLFGGTGEYESQSYLLATFTAPITIINAVISIVPLLGGCVAILISIYQLVLTYFALKVAHNLTSGKAIGVILVPIAVIFLLVCCVIAAVVGLAGAAGSSGGF